VASDFNLGNFGKRLEGSDPWENFFRTRQSLKTAMAVLQNNLLRGAK